MRQLTRRPGQLLASDDVQVQVVNGLAALGPVVYDHAVALAEALLAGDLAGSPAERGKQASSVSVSQYRSGSSSAEAAVTQPHRSACVMEEAIKQRSRCKGGRRVRAGNSWRQFSQSASRQLTTWPQQNSPKAAHHSRWPRVALSSSVACCNCVRRPLTFGIRITCVGAVGEMSRNARAMSSSYTLVHGIFPATIFSNRVSSAAAAMVRAGTRSLKSAERATGAATARDLQARRRRKQEMTGLREVTRPKWRAPSTKQRLRNSTERLVSQQAHICTHRIPSAKEKPVLAIIAACDRACVAVTYAAVPRVRKCRSTSYSPRRCPRHACLALSCGAYWAGGI